MRRRFAVTVSATAVLALAAGVPAWAAGGQPTVTHQRSSGIDAEISADLTEFCGFPISVFHEVNATIRVYPDGSERDTVNERFTTPPAASSSSSATASGSSSIPARRSRVSRACRSGSRTRAAA
jgi:hypothetical protein